MKMMGWISWLLRLRGVWISGRSYAVLMSKVVADRFDRCFSNVATTSTSSGPAPNIVVSGFGMNAASLAGKAPPVSTPKSKFIRYPVYRHER